MTFRTTMTVIFIACLSITSLVGCGDQKTVAPTAIQVEGDKTRFLALENESTLQVILPGADQKTTLGGSIETYAANVRVQYQILTQPEGADATLSADMATTDHGGRASVKFMGGRTPGYYKVEASLPDYPDRKPVGFTILNGITLFQRGRAVGKGIDDAKVGTTIASPVVLYAEKAPGVPMPGVKVAFETSSKLKIVDATSETDENGEARAFLRMGKTQGKYNFTVQVVSAPWHVPDMDSPKLEAHVYAIDWWSLSIGVLGGLAIFIFGMKQMSEGLSLVAGDRLRSVLNMLTKNRFLGVFAGVFVTGLIQSSSACSVMVIGFVNAGLMQLRQAVAVILGANIGTTITAQMLSFKLGGLALPAIAIGVVILLLAKRQQTRFIAQILIGFGLLFYGMSIMGSPLKSLKSSQTIVSFFDGLSCAPGASGVIPFGSLLQAVVAGTVMTLIVQSSSAAIGLLLAMAAAGLIDVYTGMAVLMGDNIGTTITAVLASIGSSKTAKRTACAHVIFNVLGVCIMLGLFYVPWKGHPIFMEMVNRVTPGNAFEGENITRFLANAHTGFNVMCTCALIWFISTLVWICKLIVPGRDEEEKPFRLLDEHLLSSPSIALQQAWSELGVMLKTSRGAHEQSFQALLTADKIDWEKISEEVKTQERRVDEFQTAITHYVTNLSQEMLTEEQSGTLPHLLHAVNDAERIGDYSMQLLRLAKRRRKQNLDLSKEALVELRDIYEEVEGLFTLCSENLEAGVDLESLDEHQRTERLQAVRDRNKTVKRKIKDFRKQHDGRNDAGACTIPSGVLYIDTLINLERVSAHMLNIMKAQLLGVVEE